MPGIKDFDKKFEMIRAIYETDVNSDVVDAVVSDPERSEKIKDSLRTWRTSTPSFGKNGNGWFIDELVRNLGISDKPGRWLVNCSVESFFSNLTDEDAQRVAMSVDDIEELLEGNADDRKSRKSGASSRAKKILASLSDPIHDIRYYPKHSRVDSIRSGIKKGWIDQKLCYLDPESTKAWSDVVNSASYPTYDYCFSSLDRLVRHKTWHDTFEHVGPDRAVMLGGGGAGSKDAMLLNRILANGKYSDERNLDYVLIDCSPYMLMSSLDFISDMKETYDPQGFSNLTLYIYDFLKFRGSQPVGPIDGRTAWFLSGSTIGNIDENEFFRSLGELAASGDTLTIGTNVYSDDLPFDSEALTNTYDNEALRRFVVVPLRNVLSALDHTESIVDTLQTVEMRHVSGSEARASVIEESRSVIFTIEIEGHEIVLLSSTYYSLDAFQRHAERWGWSLVHVAASGQGGHYRQLMFSKS